MTDLGLPRMSHSRFTDYVACGELYRLKRIERVPVAPSIFAVAGTVFHQWTEDYDRTPFGDTSDEAWAERLTLAVREKEEKSEFPLNQWNTPVRKPGSNQQQFEKFRDVLGPDMMRKYIDWRAQSAWSIPKLGGAEGIELELEYQVGDATGVVFIDRVFERPEEGGLVVIDIKTWSKKRVSSQLATYMVAMRQNGFRVSAAGYYDARKGEVTGLDEYRYWNEKRLAALHEQAAYGIEAGHFVPRPSDECRNCDVRKFCKYYLD